MAIVELICCICQSVFSRGESEAIRNARLGRPVYCSLSCAGKANKKNIAPETYVWSHLNPGHRRDKHSPFRVHLRLANRRAKQYGRECSLSLEDLRELWESQQGICPYTGWEMRLPQTATQYNRDAKQRDPKRASLDRIDSSKGYIQGNVQFVCHMANVAKNEYTHEQMIEFCRAIAHKFAPDEPR